MAKLIVLPPAARFLKKLKNKQLKLAYQQAIDLISLDAYNNLMENAYITSNKAYYDRLIESKNQIEQGKTIELKECAMNDE
jgi:urease gamma subunit